MLRSPTLTSLTSVNLTVLKVSFIDQMNGGEHVVDAIYVVGCNSARFLVSQTTDYPVSIKTVPSALLDQIGRAHV